VTYSALDTSAASAQPIWLYAFTEGAVVTRYTNQPENVVHGGNTYTAMAISHSAVELNGELSKDTISVTLPASVPLALQYVSDVMDQETTLIIHKGHGTDSDHQYVEWWDGSVGGGELKGAEVVLSCVSIRSLMRQPGLRRKYQKPCPHVHYGRGCWLDRDDFAVAGTLTAMSGVVLTVPAAAGYPAAHFRGGQVAEPGGIMRWIIAHSGSQITLLRPFGPDVFTALSDAGTLAVTLYPGCDRTEETCETTFDNLDNCGCLARMPIRNPYNGSSVI